VALRDGHGQAHPLISINAEDPPNGTLLLANDVQEKSDLSDTRLKMRYSTIQRHSGPAQNGIGGR